MRIARRSLLGGTDGCKNGRRPIFIRHAGIVRYNKNGIYIGPQNDNFRPTKAKFLDKILGNTLKWGDVPCAMKEPNRQVTNHETAGSR